VPTSVAYISPIKENVGNNIQSNEAFVDNNDIDRYMLEVYRAVPFTMSDFDIDISVAKAYPFVLRLSKTSFRVKKHMFAQSVFMQGTSKTTFQDEFDLTTGILSRDPSPFPFEVSSIVTSISGNRHLFRIRRRYAHLSL